MHFDIKDTLKASFKRVKEHIICLEAEIKANRDFIISQNKQIEAQNQQILDILDQIKGLKLVNFNSSSRNKGDLAPISNKSPLSDEGSSGNKGDSLDGYSLPGYSLPGYSLDIQRFKEELPHILSKVSRQEFLTFLTIYQQEEQIGRVTYGSVSKELNISTGCVRTYVSGLGKKGLPVVKNKYNNKIIILSIPSEIRGLNMKKSLIQSFYSLDPNQTKLGKDF